MIHLETYINYLINHRPKTLLQSVEELHSAVLPDTFPQELSHEQYALKRAVSQQFSHQRQEPLMYSE